METPATRSKGNFDKTKENQRATTETNGNTEEPNWNQPQGKTGNERERVANTQGKTKENK